MLLKIVLSALRVTIVVAAVLVLLWWFGMRMPGKNVSKAGPLSPDEVVLREELRASVQKLAGEIGERNMWHYTQLNTAADFSRELLHIRAELFAQHNFIRRERPRLGNIPPGHPHSKPPE